MPAKRKTLKYHKQDIGECQYFALCTNPATTTINAGPLGDVPACQQCADKMARIAAMSRR